jgi:hypothetical protein
MIPETLKFLDCQYIINEGIFNPGVACGPRIFVYNIVWPPEMNCSAWGQKTRRLRLAVGLPIGGPRTGSRFTDEHSEGRAGRDDRN